MGSVEVPVPVGGADQVNGINNNVNVPHFEEPEVAEGPYRVLDQYHSKPRKLRVACVGAGASGLCLAYKMVRLLFIITLGNRV
jgi:hypothetical protein